MSTFFQLDRVSVRQLTDRTFVLNGQSCHKFSFVASNFTFSSIRHVYVENRACRWFLYNQVIFPLNLWLDANDEYKMSVCFQQMLFFTILKLKTEQGFTRLIWMARDGYWGGFHKLKTVIRI